MPKDPFTFNSQSYDLSLFKRVGQDVFISAAVEIRRPSLVTMGRHIAIDSGFYLTTQAEFGDYIHIGPQVAVIGGAKGLFRLAGFNTVAVGARILCASDSFSGRALVTAPGIPKDFTEVEVKPVVFEKFAACGANVVVLPGVTIREGSVVGAGSIVVHDTEPWTICVGAPARPVKQRPKEKITELARQLTAS